MKTLIHEISGFLRDTKMPQWKLAAEAGVSASLVSRLVSGKCADINYTNAVALRAGMERLRQSSCSEIPNDCPKETPHAPEQERAQSPAVSRAAAPAVPA